jgi:hypothetical protein
VPRPVSGSAPTYCSVALDARLPSSQCPYKAKWALTSRSGLARLSFDGCGDGILLS